jgi:(p)ppGpp synthase/HD superfamily hydrolase
VLARPALRPVFEWAAEQHATQRRAGDDAPFILHPLEVASLLSARGYDDAVVAAGLAHDLVEQTDATLDDVRERCGERAAKLVAAVTEDPSIATFDARKAALRASMAAGGPEAHAVYAADKIAKVRELRAHGGAEPARLAHYESSLAALRAVAPDLPMVEQLAFELWALQALPPQRSFSADR